MQNGGLIFISINKKITTVFIVTTMALSAFLPITSAYAVSMASVNSPFNLIGSSQFLIGVMQIAIRNQQAKKPNITDVNKPLPAVKMLMPQVTSAKHVRPSVLEGIDYSWGYRPGFANTLKPGQKHFVMRYVNTGEGKEITAGEVKELKAAGIGIGIVFEITRKHGRPLDGFKAGQTDARISRQWVHDVGLPSNMPIYFAVDFEARGAQLTAVNNYLRGAASVLGKDKVGVYGGHTTVANALNNGVVKYAWQTYSWSYKKWDPRAQIRQYSNSHRMNGIGIDLDKTIHSDNGIQYPE